MHLDLTNVDDARWCVVHHTMAIPQSTVAPLRNRNARDFSNMQRLRLVLPDRSSASWIDTVRLSLSSERALQDVSTSKGNTFGVERKLPRFQREDLERGVGSLDTRRQPRGFNVIVLDLQDGNRDNPSENHFAGEQKQRRDPKAMHRRILSLLLCLCITCAASQSTEDQQRFSRFIRVSDSYFTLGNRKFYFTGTNCYYVLTYSVEEDTRQEVLDVFDGMEELGLTVLRMWAFNDGDRWNALQPEPGVYSRRVFRGLDWAVTEAGSRGIKLVMTLTNYFPDYGGMLQYVNWTTGSGDVNDFYSNSECKTLYKRFVRRVLNRRNSLTGVQYKDDPTIMAWELANEARYTSRSGGIAMRNWVREMSRHIKNIDPNHLVTTGSEGFFGEGELSSANPAPFFNEVGVVTELQHRVDEIDYISAHIWPTQWLPEENLRQRRQFAAQWIRAQARLGIALEKPVVFGEFGYQPDGNPRRNFYTTVYNVIYTLASRGRPVAGSNFWMLASPDYPDFGKYSHLVTVCFLLMACLS